MKKLFSVFLIILVLYLPLTAYAAIDVVDGDDDEECNHQWHEIDYDYDNNVITYECDYCSEQRTEQLEVYLDDITSPTLMLMSVEADGGYPDEHHNYRLVAFDGDSGTGVVLCYECGSYFVDSWAEHFSRDDIAYPSNYVPWFDRNHDGYINGKDYVYLLSNFTNYFDSYNSDLIQVLQDKQFYYKEIFFYCYLTVILVIISFIFCLFARRCK